MEQGSGFDWPPDGRTVPVFTISGFGFRIGLAGGVPAIRPEHRYATCRSAALTNAITLAIHTTRGAHATRLARSMTRSGTSVSSSWSTSGTLLVITSLCDPSARLDLTPAATRRLARAASARALRGPRALRLEGRRNVRA